MSNIVIVKFWVDNFVDERFHVEDTERDNQIIECMFLKWSMYVKHDRQGQKITIEPGLKQELIEAMLEVTEEDFEGDINKVLDLWKRATRNRSEITFTDFEQPDLDVTFTMDVLRYKIESLL